MLDFDVAFSMNELCMGFMLVMVEPYLAMASF